MFVFWWCFYILIFKSDFWSCQKTKKWTWIVQVHTNNEEIQNVLWILVTFTRNMCTHLMLYRLRKPREEIAFTARPKIHPHSQIFRYVFQISLMPSLGVHTSWSMTCPGIGWKVGKVFRYATVSHWFFTRLNVKKMGSLEFCLPALLGTHRNPKQN